MKFPSKCETDPSIRFHSSLPMLSIAFAGLTESKNKTDKKETNDTSMFSGMFTELT